MRPRHLNILVVFGAAVWPGGKPSPTLSRRIAAAAAAFKTGQFDVIIPSGGVGKSNPSEAEVMATVLQASGVPPENIWQERQATTTFETARYVSEMVRKHDDVVLTLLSDPYHIRRCKIAFRAFGHSCESCTTKGYLPAPALRQTARQRLRESLAIPYYLVKWMRQNHR